MEHFYYQIDGWFDFADIYKKIAHEQRSGFRFVEIGSWKGRSLAYIVVEALNVNKQFEIYAVDTFEGSIEHQPGKPYSDPLIAIKDGLYNRFLQNIRPIQEHVRVVRKTSVEASQDFPDRYFDSIFIDASHETQDVIADLNCWYPKLKYGTYLYGHDADWESVQVALDTFCRQLRMKCGNLPVKWEPISASSWRIFKKYDL